MDSYRVSTQDAGFVAGVLNVLIGWDARSCVHVVVRPRAIGMFAAPPTGCVIFAAIPLAAPGTSLSRTVAAGRLRDVIGDVARPRSSSMQLRIPDEVSTPIDLLELPPLDGWQFSATIDSGSLVQRLADDVAEFRSKVPVDGSTQPDVAERVAQEIWSRKCWDVVPVRAAHTAKSLGWLANATAPVQSGTVTQWTRLATGAGQVFTNASSSNLRLPLSVL